MSEFDAGSIKSTADVDMARFKRGLDEMERRGEKFAKSTYKARLDLDDSALDRKLTAAEKRLAGFGGTHTARLEVAGDADKKIDAVHRSLQLITGRRWDVELSLSTESEQLEAFEQRMRRLDGMRATAHVEVTGAREAQVQVGSLDSMLARITSRRWTANLDLNGFAEAMVQLNALGAMLQRFEGYRATARVDLSGVGESSAEVAALRAQLAALNNQQANARIGMSGGSDVLGTIGLILGGLGAIGYAAPAAAGALAAIPQALIGAGTLIGAVTAGLSGVGDAYKAMGQADEQAATVSTGAGKAREAAALQVKSATRSLAQAHEQATRSQITSEWSVSDAARAAAEARAQAYDRVRMADRALADAREAAGERVADSMRSEQRAAEQLRTAQDQLSRAWEKGREELEDLQLALEGGALSQERAALQLQRARQRLAEGMAKGATGLEAQELELDVREAEYGLKTAAERMGDLRKEQATFAREGVAGSQAVKTARQQVTSAEQAYGDAVRARQQSERDGAKQVLAAEEQLHAAQVEGRKQIADADRAYTRAAVQARWQQADAAASVAAAEDQLAQAIKGTADAAVGGAAKVDKLALAMGKLTPEGRAFVRFLHDEFVPGWRPVKEISQAEFLPGVTDGMRRFMGLQPTVTTGVGLMASVLGDLAVEGGKVSEQPAFKRDLGIIMESNARSMHSFGQAGLTGVESMVDLGVATGPVAEHFARVVQYGSQAVESWLLGKAASGELSAELWEMSDRLGDVWQFLQDVTAGVWGLSQGLAPLGAFLLDVVGSTVRWVGELAAANPTLASVAGGSILAAGAVLKLGAAIGAMQASQTLSGVATLAGGIRTALTPSALQATSALQSLSGMGAVAGGHLGAMTGRVTGSSTAMATGAVRGAAFGRAISTVASGLPLVGVAALGVVLAYDALNTSSSEAADAMLNGGVAASKMKAELAENDRSLQDIRSTMPGWLADLEEWNRRTFGTMTTTQMANEELERQIATMGPLEAAQARATLAQNTYEDALRRTGPASAETTAALQGLRDATRQVEIKQIMAREKVDEATAAIMYQRDQIMGTIDADLQKRRATQQLADAQKRYGDAVREHGPASAEAQRAALDLEEAQKRLAEAAKQGADGMAGYGRAVGDMVLKSKGELSPTLQKLVQGMDSTALSAAGASVKIDGAGRAVATFPGGKTVVLDANLSQLPGQLAAAKNLVDSTRGTIGVDADPTAGVATVGAFRLRTNATTGVISIDGNITPADQQRLGIRAKTDGTTGTMWIDGNPVPADGQLNGMRVTVNKTTGVMTIDGNPDPAKDAGRDAKNAIGDPNTAPVITPKVDAKPAEGFFERIWRKISSWQWWIGNPVAPPPGLAAGGPVGMARGGVAGFPVGGSVRGPGSATSDSIPAMLSNGEYVVRAAAVRQVGVPALDAINRLRDGGLVGLAGGGTPENAPQAPGGPSAPRGGASPAVPTVAAGAASGAAAGLAEVSSAATLQAAVLTGTLVPALAAVHAATMATEVGAQQLIAGGIVPLAAAVEALLAPAVGVMAPAAHNALQAAQDATQASTLATAQNTSVNSTWMAQTVAAMSLAAQAQHAGLRLGQALTRGSTMQTAAVTSGQHQAMTGSTVAMSLAAQAQHAGLRLGQALTRQSTDQTAANTSTRHGQMMASTGQMSQVNQGHLAGLRGGQQVTTGSTTAFADAWRAQLGRTMPDSANPLRWVINTPIRSITDAWNNLDRQFALGKQVPPYVARFATGGTFTGAGRVRGPGTGTSDEVNARLSDGEFVVRQKVASRVPHFLKALNAGQAEAVQAAGGQGARMPGYAAGGVIAAQQFARGESGKPYQWGGVGNPSWDCSGLMSGITNVLRGQPPRRRLGTTSSMPWGGFTPGLRGAFTIGNTKSRGHMAGTLGGVNVESGGTHGVHYGPPAIGADNSLFNEKWTLPQVGGVFASGGAGGGSGFDPTPMVEAAFAKAYREIGDVPRFFGPSDQVARDQGVARFSADKVKAKALAKLAEMFAASGLGPLGAGAPFYVQQIANAARVRGLGVDGATIGVATSLVETNLRNLANRAVPASLRLPNDGLGGDHDSVGLFQQRQAGWGTVEQRMNPFASAGMFFDRLMRFNWRGMDPGAAAQKVQVSAYPAKYGPQMGYARQLVGTHGGRFSDGGVVPGTGTGDTEPAMLTPGERVLTTQQTDRFDALVDGVLSSARATGSVSLLTGDALAQIESRLGGGDVADEVAALRAELGAVLAKVVELAGKAGAQTFVVNGARDPVEAAHAVAAEQDFRLQLIT